MNQKTHYLTQDPEAIRLNTIFLQGAFLNNFFDKSEKEKKSVYFMYFIYGVALALVNTIKRKLYGKIIVQ